MTDWEAMFAWLRAQLDDDERVAQEASYWTWQPEHAQEFVSAQHVARWDPARALAEVDGKRRLLELHAPVPTGPTWQPGPPQCEHCAMLCHSTSGVNCDSPDAPYPCPTVRLLALPYAHRAGYRDEWRP